MADINPELFENFNKLSDLLGSINGAFGSMAKSATYQRLQQEQSAKKLEQLAKSLGEYDKGLLARIKAEAKAAEEEEKKQLAIGRHTDALVNGASKALGGLKDFAVGVTQSAMAVYNSDKVFSAIVPTVDLLANAFKSALGALTAITASIPIIGGFMSAADKALSAVTDIATSVVKMQIDGAQKYLDTMIGLQKAGLMLKGDFDLMTKSAHDAGLGVNQYNKFVLENMESLSKFGGTVNDAARKAGQLAVQLRNEDKQLVLMYGSYEELAGATAKYMSIMSQSGTDYRNNQAGLNAALKEYLYTSKELNALTGVSVETSRKEQEARLRQLGYQNRIAEMNQRVAGSGDRMAQVQADLSVMLGKDFGDYFQELIANNGKVISETNLRYQAMNPVAAQFASQLQTMNPEILASGKATGALAEIMTRFAPQLKAEYGPNGRLAYMGNLATAVQDETVQQIARTGAAFNAAQSKFTDAETAAAEIIAKRNKSEQNLSTAQTETTKALEAQKKYQMDMDLMIKGFIPQVGQLTAKMYEFQQTLINKFPIEVFDKAVNKFLNIIDKLIGESGINARPTIVTTETINQSRVSKGLEPFVPNAERQAADQKASMKFGRSGMQTSDITRFMTDVKRDRGSEALRKGGLYDPRLADYLNAYIISEMGQKFPVGRVTGLDDQHHQDLKYDSAHKRGRAVDFTLAGGKPSAEDWDKIRIALIMAGFKNLKNEYEDKSGSGRTGDHIHAELQQGAIVSGGSGGITARVGEGSKDELVMPLSGGMMPGMRELLEKVDNLVRINRDQLDHLEQTKYLLS